MIVEWLNFIIFNICWVVLTILSKISVMPVSREEKRGEKAWEECAQFRELCGIFELVMVINIFLWIWFSDFRVELGYS
ncbi:MAG: hypothetical protein ACTSR3_13840 [Candidatus Helarchaeota archaeon]